MSMSIYVYTITTILFTNYVICLLYAYIILYISIWDQHLSGTLPHTATIGDVDGDGQLDVVIISVDDQLESHIYAFRGDTGEVLAGYPVALPKGAVVTAPVLLADLHTYTEADFVGSPLRYCDVNMCTCIHIRMIVYFGCCIRCIIYSCYCLS